MISQNVSLKLASGVIIYKLIQAIIFSVIIAVIIKFIPPTSHYYILVGVGLVVLTVLYAILFVSTFSYVITAESIIINSGVVFKTSKTVNYNDLQNIQIKNGPLLAMCGLSNLLAFTSSPAQMMVSGNGRNTQTTYMPDVQILMAKLDAQELSQMMRVGDIQKVRQA
jgi:membrane protein YdbS with pleckstrin-like domain